MRGAGRCIGLPARRCPCAATSAAQAAPSALTPRAFLPSVSLTTTCPTTSSTVFDLVPIEGAYYKNNALTDENADFRLSSTSVRAGLGKVSGWSNTADQRTPMRQSSMACSSQIGRRDTGRLSGVWLELGGWRSLTDAPIWDAGDVRSIPAGPLT